MADAPIVAGPSAPADAAAPGRSFGGPWIALTVALALHVTDEAAHDFLTVYNPVATQIRERLPFLPLPTFTFRVWITGLAAGILLLAMLSPLALRGNRWLRLMALPFSGLMFANGLGHIGGSLYTHTLMAGVWSSPLLLAASAWLFFAPLPRRGPQPAASTG